MSEDGMHCIGPDTFLYDGTTENPTIEGPKVYHRNGYYYIFAPAGGVKYGWQVVLRSKNIYGPYEAKTVMHQGSSNINGPHQGGLTDTLSGEEWFLHFQDAGVYGRICHLQPVIWKDNWPVIGKENGHTGCGEPQLQYTKPSGCPSVSPVYLEASDSFSSDTLGLQWQWLANPKPDFYSLTARRGALRLYSVNPTPKAEPLLWNCANVLTQKIVCPQFRADFTLDVSGLQPNERTGTLIIGAEYMSLAVQKKDSSLMLICFESFTDKDNAKQERNLFSIPVEPLTSVISLRISFYKNRVCRMSYCLAPEAGYTELPFDFTPSAHTWTGVKAGMYSTALDCSAHTGFADFLNVFISPISE